MCHYSKELSERASKVLFDAGDSTSRGLDVLNSFPPYLERAEGCRLFDIDGESYIDWMNAFGALPTGHAHPAVVEAAMQAMSTGAHYAAAIPQEIDLAELMLKLVPSIEKVRFTNSATEATMAGIRLARGYTGRNKILKFEGHYHGWSDAMLLTTNPQPVSTLGHPNSPVGIVDSSGIPHGAIEDTIVAPWNDIDALDRVFKDKGREIACVVTEGIMANVGIILPDDGYLEQLQALCQSHDVLLYLDESVTGFHVAPGGCVELFGLDPDIVTYGKALGHGFPLAATAARKELMDGADWGTGMHFGTFNGHRVGVCAGLAGMTALHDDDNAGFKHLVTIGEAVVAGVRDVIARHNKHDIICQSAGSLFQIYFTDASSIGDFRAYCQFVDSEKYTRFADHLRNFGIYLSPRNTLHNSSTLAHTTQDVDKTINAFAEALRCFE